MFFFCISICTYLHHFAVRLGAHLALLLALHLLLLLLLPFASSQFLAPAIDDSQITLDGIVCLA